MLEIHGTRFLFDIPFSLCSFKNYINCVTKFPGLLRLSFNTLFDFSKIDFILISNTENLMSIPYITRNKKFKGKIFGTQVTKEFGRQCMEELVSYASWYQTCDNQDWNEFVKCQDESVRDLCLIYTRQEIYEALERITCVTFNEHVRLSLSLSLKAVSSGYELGSCNWIVDSQGIRISLVSSSSLLQNIYAESMETLELLSSSYIIWGGRFRENSPKNDVELLDSFYRQIGHCNDRKIPLLLPVFLPSSFITLMGKYFRLISRFVDKILGRNKSGSKNQDFRYITFILTNLVFWCDTIRMDD